MFYYYITKGINGQNCVFEIVWMLKTSLFCDRGVWFFLYVCAMIVNNINNRVNMLYSHFKFRLNILLMAYFHNAEIYKAATARRTWPALPNVGHPSSLPLSPIFFVNWETRARNTRAQKERNFLALSPTISLLHCYTLLCLLLLAHRPPLRCPLPQIQRSRAPPPPWSGKPHR